MARRRTERSIKPSLLDRLTDLEPDRLSDPAPATWQEMRDLKAGLCRDLAALLNTRRKEQVLDPAYESCVNSVLTYGMSDFTSYNLTNGVEQELVRRSMERAIRQFEPRLTRVTVSMEEPNSTRPTLQFQIDAVLRIDTTENVAFDLRLHRDSRRITVSGSDR